jgi:hypothetical protein
MPKKINVKLNPDGTPECVPTVTHVRPGGTLVWTGKKHSGHFDGKIPGPPRDNFTLADLHALQPQPGPMPFDPTSWAIVDEAPGAHNPDRVHVAPDAQSGVMYKYTITAGGKPLDPVVIIDDSATDD